MALTADDPNHSTFPHITDSRPPESPTANEIVLKKHGYVAEIPDMKCLSWMSPREDVLWDSKIYLTVLYCNRSHW